MTTMRPIVITCPTTNEQVNTGIRMTEEAFEREDFRGQEYHCTRCGQKHTWDKSSARLDANT